MHKTNKNNTENSFHRIEVDINHLFWPFFPFRLHSNENQFFLLNLGENEIRNETKPNHNLRQFLEREGAGLESFLIHLGVADVRFVAGRAPRKIKSSLCAPLRL